MLERRRRADIAAARRRLFPLVDELDAEAARVTEFSRASGFSAAAQQSIIAAAVFTPPSAGRILPAARRRGGNRRVRACAALEPALSQQFSASPSWRSTMTHADSVTRAASASSSSTSGNRRRRAAAISARRRRSSILNGLMRGNRAFADVDDYRTADCHHLRCGDRRTGRAVAADPPPAKGIRIVEFADLGTTDYNAPMFDGGGAARRRGGTRIVARSQGGAAAGARRRRSH